MAADSVRAQHISGGGRELLTVLESSLLTQMFAPSKATPKVHCQRIGDWRRTDWWWGDWWGGGKAVGDEIGKLASAGNI